VPVQPKILKGFRDLPASEVLARERIISTIKGVFESYGFAPLYTPALEYKEVLLGYGEEASKQIFLFTDPDGNEVGLRFDLTVPLSRYVALNKNLPRPYRRYQVQPVWRYDKPDPGRFREFMQFDIDTVGTASMVADAEIISAMHDSLAKLGLQFRIRFSNRKVLNSLMEFAKLPSNQAHALFRVIDKLEKQGLEAVKSELGPGRIDSSGAEIKGLGFEKEQIQKIEEFLKLPQRTRKEAIDSLRKLFKQQKSAEEGIRELSEIDESLTALGITDEKAKIDLSIARGLDYYTGPVYEAVLSDAPDFGSVMGGGRYDELIEKFTGEKVPATGASVGVDRLFSAMQELGSVEEKHSTAEVLITVMVKEKMTEYQRIARELREAGIKTEVYVGNESNLGNQLKYADRMLIPVAVLIGKQEFSKNEVSLKNLKLLRQIETEKLDREAYLGQRIGQKTVALENLIDEVKAILEGHENEAATNKKEGKRAVT
jgi:histidyl-tRNA synthetase